MRVLLVLTLAAYACICKAQDNTTASAAAATTPSVPISTDCLDKVTTCRTQGAEGCVGIYEPYARANCPRYCKYCINPEDLNKPCENKISNCNEYQSDLCTNPQYTIFAEDNCAKFCNLCDRNPRPVGVGSTASTGGSVPSVTTNGTCKDLVDYCWTEIDANCFGIYKPWAMKNCPYRCGFCDEKPPCEDAITYCAQYDSSVCTDDYYAGWVRKNCRKTCNLCALPTEPPFDPNAPVVTAGPDGATAAPPAAGGSGTTVPPPNAVGQVTLPATNPGVDGAVVAGQKTTFIIQGPPPLIKGTCLYKGDSHPQDKNWYDGCDFTCNCFDANRNRIVCTQRCIQWDSLPLNLTGCALVQEPGDCCKRLECNV